MRRVIRYERFKTQSNNIISSWNWTRHGELRKLSSQEWLPVLWLHNIVVD